MKNPFENSRKIIKNVVLATTLATGIGMVGSQDLKAGGVTSGNKASIENLQKEHVLHGVDAKQLKKLVSDYESSPGVPLEMFLDAHKGDSFTVVEAVGQTSIAAKISAEEKLKVDGKISMRVFTQKLGNGNVSVILVAVEK